MASPWEEVQNVMAQADLLEELIQLRLEGHKEEGREAALRWAVDHDHKTGKIRGLLCSSCNKALGFLQDSPILALAAYRYLKGTDI